MTLPAEISRLFIFRKPLGGAEVYSIISEDRSYFVEVTCDDYVSGIEWTLKFKSPTGITFAPMSMNWPMRFVTEAGECCGSAHEAPFSVAGKSVITDAIGNVVGIVKPKWAGGARLLSPDDTELGVATRLREDKLPFVLRETFRFESGWPLANRFVLERTSQAALDERLIFFFVCGLVFQEKI